MRRLARPTVSIGACILLALANDALARHGDAPYSLTHPALLARDVPTATVGSIDAAARREQADARQRSATAAPTKRLATADELDVAIRSDRDGRWDRLPDGSRLWRVAVAVRGATDLRFMFDRFALPAGATLHVIGADAVYQGPYDRADAGADGFRSAVVPGDSATIELHVPAGIFASDAIELARVGAGFRDLFKRIEDTGPGTSGECNVNVVCPLGQPYPDPIRAVAYYEFEDNEEHATFICSGTLVADVPRDRRNYFLTAAHCITSASEAASMVIYWNYESTSCNALGAPSGGFFADDQRGASLRATRADADFSLVELAQTPDTAWHVYYAGWDASGALPSGTIGLHHPNGDVKKVTAGPAPGTTDNCIGTGGASTNTHWETGPYSQGTTEGGSSGSGLFANVATAGGRAGLLIGTLSGGFAACSATNPSEPNDETDCYGKLAGGWNGTSAATRLRDWLDPAQTGTLIGAGVDSQAATSGRGHSHHRRVQRPDESRD